MSDVITDASMKIAELELAIADLTTSIDLFFVLTMGIICFLLQAGFGLLEVGSIRSKNAQNIMLKNIMDAAVAAIAYYAFGYSLAYGKCSRGVDDCQSFTSYNRD
jgi:Amt family ammonium transporter